MQKFFLILSLFALITFDMPAHACQRPFGLAYKVISVPGGPLTAVWYPTSSAEKSYNYGSDFSSTLAENGEPQGCKKFPLIIFSHGMAGCGTQSIFFMEMLARMGYVVASPDHSDAGLCKINNKSPMKSNKDAQSFLEPHKWTAQTEIDRRNDMKQVLDWML